MHVESQAQPTFFFIFNSLQRHKEAILPPCGIYATVLPISCGDLHNRIPLLISGLPFSLTQRPK
jgi:hypothetical protein